MDLNRLKKLSGVKIITETHCGACQDLIEKLAMKVIDNNVDPKEAARELSFQISRHRKLKDGGSDMEDSR